MNFSNADQKPIHDLVKSFLSRVGWSEVLFITNNPEYIKQEYLNQDTIVYISCSRLQLLRNRKRFLSIPENNIKLVPLRHINDEFLENKLVVCVDYLDENMSDTLLFKSLLRILTKAPLTITHQKHGKRMSALLVRTLMQNNKNALCTKNSERSIIIGGSLTDVSSTDYQSRKVLAIVAQYNEGDIICATTKHLLDQGVDVHIIDNWSNDGSYEDLSLLKKGYPDRISIERYPAKNTGKYEWERILKRIEGVAKSKPEYDWIIFNDADEIRWSPWPNISLRGAISFIDSLGYNCIDYTVFNFFPTYDGFGQKDNPLDFFEFGEFGAENWYFIQLKTWKNNPDAKMSHTGGHVVEFPGRKIYPLKFFLGHYSIRSSQQGKRKIFKDRKPRFKNEEKSKGWHMHYDKTVENTEYIRKPQGLIKFSDKKFWENYLLQRVAGVGIKKK